jgi:hypothetical protein
VHSTPCRREYDGTAQALSVSSASEVTDTTANAAAVRASDPADSGSLIFIVFPLGQNIKSVRQIPLRVSPTKEKDL